MAQISNCLKLISKIDERDQDALVARLDELQAQGVPAERAQIQAAIDVLTAVQGDNSDSNVGSALTSKARAAIKSGVTETPEFKRWFGNSKVVDDNGKPLVVYHGTLGPDVSAGPEGGIAGWFAEGAELANVYTRMVAYAMQRRGLTEDTATPQVIPAYLAISNPLDLVGRYSAGEIMNAAEFFAKTPEVSPFKIKGDLTRAYEFLRLSSVLDALRSRGYDGIRVQERDVVTWAALRPEQIKSATGNNGAFDPADANITRSATRTPAGVEIVEVEDGFDAMKDGKRIGRLRDNLPRGAAEQLDENASVDIVKVDSEFKGQGVGSALYEAFNEKHGGRIAPSGKTSPEAWALWKRKFPQKVGAFVEAEAGRIRDGADPMMVVRNITDPDVARRVSEAAGDVVIRSAARQTETPEFKRWFGDSKVVDADGKPLVVYHGSTSGGISSATVQNTFFTPNRDVANSYALDESASRSEGQLVVNPVYIRIENPLIVDADGAPWMAIPFEGGSMTTDGIAAIAKERGHDGVLIKNVEDNVNDEELPPADIYITLGKRGQIKSATGNNGAFDPADANITRSVARPEFFSQLQRSIEQVPDRLASMAAPQWKLWLDANAPKLGVKKDEVEWSTIKDYLTLRGKDKVSRDELGAYLGSSGVRVQEVVLQDGDWAVYDGEDNQYFGTRAEAVEYANEMGINVTDDTVFRGTNRAGGFGAKYGSYTVPGGENYREVLITLPSEVSVAAKIAALKARELSEKMRNAESDEEYEALRKERADLAGKAKEDPSYKSSHWDAPNVIAHIRVDDRVDADGKKILFVNELQSDFGQDYRKAKEAIESAVDADFQGIVERMKKAGVLEVVCD